MLMCWLRHTSAAVSPHALPCPPSQVVAGRRHVGLVGVHPVGSYAVR